MEVISDRMFRRPSRKIRVMQFGEGNFLRGFADWVLQKLNDDGAMDAGVVAVQPREGTGIESLKSQDGLYTLRLEGRDDTYVTKWSRVMDVIEDCLDPYEEYERFLAYGDSEDLEVVISNTTERGIVLDEKDTDFEKCPTSFPGKLLALLERRYTKFEGKGHGLAIIPCELVYDNGDVLRDCLIKLAEKRGMDEKFIKWMTEENHFTSTVADRIIAGYPADEIAAIQEETGYIDNCVVKGEYYLSWVLKKEPFVENVFPAELSGLNVQYVDDVKPYQVKKERMLNGAHTAIAAVAYMCGMDDVFGAMTDPDIESLATEIVDEAAETVGADEQETKKYADEVMLRLCNPYIKHSLSAINSNCTEKFAIRLQPVIEDYVAAKGAVPKAAVFALAALATYCKGVRGKEKIELRDDEKVLSKWADIWTKHEKNWNDIAKAILGWKAVWGKDLSTVSPDLKKALAEYLEDIDVKGMKEAAKDMLNG